jgi:hypothetical protein
MPNLNQSIKAAASIVMTITIAISILDPPTITVFKALPREGLISKNATLESDSNALYKG